MRNKVFSILTVLLCVSCGVVADVDASIQDVICFDEMGYIEAGDNSIKDIELIDGPLKGLSAIQGDANSVVKGVLKGNLDQGSILFWFKTDQGYITGLKGEKKSVPLIEIEDLLTINFERTNFQIILRLAWDESLEDAYPVNIVVPEFPAGWSHLAISWNADEGIMDAYLNGTYTNYKKAKRLPWQVDQRSSRKIKIFPEFAISNFEISDGLLKSEMLQPVTQSEYAGKTDPALGVREIEKFDPEPYKGELIYERSFSDSNEIEGWKLEGPGEVMFENGWMTMQSTRPDGPQGHIVHWCDKKFPESFVAQWEFQVLSDNGLCIVFFASKGINGESIFDDSLKERNGVFAQYIFGDINSYHISYFANTPWNSGGRLSCNLRKNSGAYLVHNGPALVKPKSRDIHLVTLVKDGPHIMLSIDGDKTIDFKDNGNPYGPALQDGWIGLRQMQWTKARYRNFRVYELNTDK